MQQLAQRTVRWLDLEQSKFESLACEAPPPPLVRTGCDDTLALTEMLD